MIKSRVGGYQRGLEKKVFYLILRAKRGELI